MKVEIWSDIRCPFCYIGKHNFEKALEQFEGRDSVDVVWRSFQLDPNLETRPEKDMIEYFVELKGISREQAEQMLAGAKQMGNSMGLDFNLENSVLANSFQAHQLVQYAKTQNKGSEMKEVLFKAHFTFARNIDDLPTLLDLAVEIGLDSEETQKLLEKEEFAYSVKQDEMAARNIGVQGVPFFVFDDKYAVSGAQPIETFLEVLQKFDLNSRDN